METRAEKTSLSWIEYRQDFTQRAVANLWAKAPNPNPWVACVCYNQAWGVKDPKGISEITQASVTYDSYLYVDYDCMYIADGNSFWTYGDGGYENVSVLTDKQIMGYLS